MLEAILDGENPTSIFRRLIIENCDIGNIRLGQIFCDEFPNVDGLAEQLIWHWMGPGKSQGIDDAGLNAELTRLLKESGYKILCSDNGHQSGDTVNSRS